MSSSPTPPTFKLPEFFPDVPEMRAELARYIGEVNRVDRIVSGSG